MNLPEEGLAVAQAILPRSLLRLRGKGKSKSPGSDYPDVNPLRLTGEHDETAPVVRKALQWYTGRRNRTALALLGEFVRRHSVQHPLMAKLKSQIVLSLLRSRWL